MTPNRQKIHRAFVIVLIVLSACTPTRPPTSVLDDAAAALAAARNAGASTYAPLELRNAEDHLNQAHARMDKGDYDQATWLAQDCRIDSELAAIKARLGQDREKVEARTRENAQLRQDLSTGTQPATSGAQP